MYAVAIVRTAVYKCVSIWLTPLWDGWEHMFTTFIIQSASYTLVCVPCAILYLLQRRVWDSVCTAVG